MTEREGLVKRLSREDIEDRRKWWAAKLIDNKCPLREEREYWESEVAICDLAIAALTAQPQQEPDGWWLKDEGIAFPANEFSPVAAENPERWIAIYTAPQPGVRERMLLKALKRINDVALSHPYAGNTCGEIARQAITRAAEQINAEGQERTPSVGDGQKGAPSAPILPPAPSAPHAEQTHVSVPVEDGK